MSNVDTFKTLTGCSNDSMANIMLERAEAKILSLCNRTRLNEALAPLVVDWAVIAYNRLGTEGESSRSEGGISSAFVEIPADIQRIIEMNRIARVGGHAYEKKADEDLQS